MNCTTAQQLLQLYLDHQLEPVEARTLEQHVAQCPNCRTEFLLLERSVLGLESLAREAAPKLVYSNTMALVMQHHRNTLRSGELARLLSNGSVVVVALIGLLFSLSSNVSIPSFLTALDADGFLGVVDSAVAITLSAEVSFIAGIGLLFAACTIGLFQLMVYNQSASYR